jgi:Rieske Fe-S protein
MSCEDCVNRRDFLAKSALAAAALVVAEGCGDGQIGPKIPATSSGTGDPDAPTTNGVTVFLSQTPALATVGTLVAISGDRALIRTGATTFQGFSRICTHEQCITDIKNNRFECPCHGSIFANDGTVVRGPDIASPPIDPLHKLTTTFDQATGKITVA